MASMIFQQQSPVELLNSMYTAYPDASYVGIYQFLRPTLIIRDTQLIKQVTVKEIDSFPNHDTLGNKEGDPIATKNLFSLSTDDGWHNMRTTLSPAFTGFKMKAMFLLMDKSADQLIDYFQNKDDLIIMDIKDAFRKYTNDVVAATVFGIESNSFRYPSNAFYKMSKALTDFEGFRSLKIFGNTISPVLMKLFRISVFNQRACEFFRNIIKESIRISRQKQVKRPDMIHLLIEASKNNLEHDDPNNNVKSKHGNLKTERLVKPIKEKNVNITIDDITAQTLAFFFAAYETTSTLMSYVAYELALNPTVQERLREEVDKALNNCKGKLRYEDMAGMKYLDKVISETLRKWPPDAGTDRRSIRPFVVAADRPGEKLLYLESGTVCWIPIFAIQGDPKHYPNPIKFDPERFSDQNKHNIKPYTFLPFGSGPRNCMGSRFAILETKLIILRILQKFDIIPVHNTPREIKLSKLSYQLTPKQGLWLGLKLRLVGSV